MKNWKRLTKLMAATLASLMIFGVATTVLADATPYVSLGADLSEEGRATVLSLLGVDESMLSDATTTTVTNADEHTYLDSYLDPAVIGTKALSSVKVVQEASGHGITVETHNINYVTKEMYANALATAGMSDASVTVAAPFEISGTAALVGAMKAYGQMTGTVIEPTLFDGAIDELVTTSELGDNLDDPAMAAKIIAAAKQIIAANEYTSEEDIDKTIDDVAKDLEVTLSEEDRALIRELLQKLSKLDLNAENLSEQAQGIYEDLKNSGFDVSKYGVTDEEVQGFIARIRQFFDWLKSLFGG